MSLKDHQVRLIEKRLKKEGVTYDPLSEDTRRVPSRSIEPRHPYTDSRYRNLRMFVCGSRAPRTSVTSSPTSR